MAAVKRYKTKYPGVFFIEGKTASGGKEQIFYIRYRRNGKMVEEKAGRSIRNDMTASKASTLRGLRIDGKDTTNKEEREAKIAAKKAEESRWTIQKLWDEYTRHKPESKALSTDKNRYDLYIKDALGKMEPSEIQSLDVERLKRKMLKTKSPQTVKHALGILKRIVNYGANHGLSSALSFKIQMPPVDNIKTEDLSPEQLKKLLKAIDQDENQAVAAMMKMALFTGMRRGELFKLMWQHVDFHRGFIEIVNPKGGRSQKIPINEAARKVLEGVEKTQGSQFVFPGEDGGQRVSAQKASRRIRERAGLPKDFRPFHGLRHVFASTLASSGQVDMYILQKLLTHKSPQMTQRYAHLRDEALRGASDVASDIFSKATRSGKVKKIRVKK